MFAGAVPFLSTGRDQADIGYEVGESFHGFSNSNSNRAVDVEGHRMEFHFKVLPQGPILLALGLFCLLQMYVSHRAAVCRLR